MIAVAACLLLAALVHMVRVTMRDGRQAGLMATLDTLSTSLGMVAFILAVGSVSASAAEAGEPLPSWLPPSKRVIQLVMLVGSGLLSAWTVFRKRRRFRDAIDIVGFLSGSMGLPQVVIEVGYDH